MQGKDTHLVIFIAISWLHNYLNPFPLLSISVTSTRIALWQPHHHCLIEKHRAVFWCAWLFACLLAWLIVSFCCVKQQAVLLNMVLKYGETIKRKRKNGAIEVKAIRRDPGAMQCIGRITMDIFLCHLNCLALIYTMSTNINFELIDILNL